MHEDDGARFRTAMELLTSGDDTKRTSGLALLQSLAEGGHAESQFHLGLHFAHTAGDHDQAARWCAAAARQGFAPAQFNLGLLFVAGCGVAKDPEAAGHWLRLSAANGLPEAESCLELIHADPDPRRPKSWNEAETRASVALAQTDPDAPKALRFAEYYVDPCIDLLTRRCRISREQSEDIAQQFFLELEEDLSKGAYKGRPWKTSLRSSFDRNRAFRPYLGRILLNFAHDWLRHRTKRESVETHAVPIPEQPNLDHALDHHREWWIGQLDRFLVAVSNGNPNATRAARVLDLLLRDALGQQETGRRLGVSDRTVRSDLRLATELLCGWLRANLEKHGCIDDLIESGLQQLPDWLHHPIGTRRARALLFLALAGRRLAGRQGT